MSGPSWNVCDSVASWDPEMVKHSKYSQWTEEERGKQMEGIVRRISKLLSQANVQYIDQLKGIPVEVTFNGNLLTEWRILEEVL